MSRQGRLAYHPEFDGSRGFGMLLVLSFHVGQVILGHAEGEPPGGWLGLDVFFALSGMLITSLLLVEWEQAGTVNLRAFYARRIARLGPALLVLLAAQVIATAVAGTAVTRNQLTPSLAWVLGQGSNFGVLSGHVMGKLAHTWSLAVEEQFYLVWPIALVTALRAGWSRRRLRAALGALIGTLVAARLAASLLGASPEATYFATPFRIDEILVGCWAALGRGPSPVTPRLRNIAVLVIFVFLIGVPQASSILPRGGYTLVAICSTIVLVPGNAVWVGHRVLSWGPFVRLGRISYSVYLWHWPTFYAARFVLGVDRWLTVVVGVAAALCLGAASAVCVEVPLRTAAARRRSSVPGVRVIVILQMATVLTAARLLSLQPLPTLVLAVGSALLGTGLILALRSSVSGRWPVNASALA